LDINTVLNLITTFVISCLFPLILWVLSKQFNLENRLSTLEGKVDIIIRYINGFASILNVSPSIQDDPLNDSEKEKKN